MSSQNESQDTQTWMTDRSAREWVADNDMDGEMLCADGFDAAIIGYVDRFGQPSIVLYDREMCIQILIQGEGMTEEEALEHFEYNVIGGWVGDYTPAFATLYRGE